MKKLFFTMIAAAGLCFSGLAQKNVNDPNAEVRAISGSFSAIKVGNAIELILTESNEEKVVVSANEPKVRDRIKAEITNGELKIYYDNDWGVKINWSRNDYMRVYVSYKTLNSVKASGASSVRFENDWQTDNATLKLSGASSFKATIKANKLDADLSGASQATVSGTAGALSMEASGASTFHGFDLNTTNSSLEVHGASTAHVQTDKEIKVEASGASTVRYKGNAVIRDIKVSGASSVKKA